MSESHFNVNEENSSLEATPVPKSSLEVNPTRVLDMELLNELNLVQLQKKKGKLFFFIQDMSSAIAVCLCIIGPMSRRLPRALSPMGGLRIKSLSL